MRNNARHFHIFDLEIGAKKNGASIPSMASLVPIFERLHRTGQVYPIRGGTGTLLIGDIAHNAAQQFVTLLVRLSDKLTPNSVYSDPTAGRFDEHLKIGNVGSDFGCHVFISTAPEQGLHNIYTCAIERVPGLAPELVRRLLSKLLAYEFRNNAASFSYPSPGGGNTRAGQPRMERCLPHIELRGRPSDSLIADINNGTLSGVSLIKAEQVTPIAGSPFLTKSKSELKLSVDRNNLPANVWASLQDTLRRNSQNYQSAKISYKVAGTNRIVTVEFDAATSAPITDLYFKSFELTNIFPFLAQSARSIVPHLRDLAVPQFIANRTI